MQPATIVRAATTINQVARGFTFSLVRLGFGDKVPRALRQERGAKHEDGREQTLESKRYPPAVGQAGKGNVDNKSQHDPKGDGELMKRNQPPANVAW